MSIDYRIKAYPTEYKGRRFRSRLEARWAAFFDILGWRAEYEPFDLGKWSPDFQITLHPGLVQHTQILVEVKPTAFPDMENADILDKGVKAVLERGLDQTSVPAVFTQAPYMDGDRVLIGGGRSRTNTKFRGVVFLLGWLPHSEQPAMYPDLIAVSLALCKDPKADATGCLSGYKGKSSGVCWYPDYTMELWARASNAVQWLGRDA